ncbi:hypothetical protein CBL_10772 [Carabus blaptoides fortunei]
MAMKTETEICAVRTNCLWYDKKLKEVQHHPQDHTEFQICNGLLYRRFWDPSDITELNENSEWKRPPRISTPSPPPLPVDFKIPTTPTRRLDTARIAQELSVMPVMLSPLPVTPDQVGKPPPFSPSDWLYLDTSLLLVTPERANTPSPQRDLYAPRLLELAPAPMLSESTKKNRMYQLFCSASSPTRIKEATPAPTCLLQPVLVQIPLEAPRPPTCLPPKDTDYQSPVEQKDAPDG